MKHQCDQPETKEYATYELPFDFYFGGNKWSAHLRTKTPNGDVTGIGAYGKTEAEALTNLEILLGRSK